jgi:hypothetical protein
VPPTRIAPSLATDNGTVPACSKVKLTMPYNNLERQNAKEEGAPSNRHDDAGFISWI